MFCGEGRRRCNGQRPNQDWRHEGADRQNVAAGKVCLDVRLVDAAAPSTPRRRLPQDRMPTAKDVDDTKADGALPETGPGWGPLLACHEPVLHPGRGDAVGTRSPGTYPRNHCALARYFANVCKTKYPISRPISTAGSPTIISSVQPLLSAYFQAKRVER